MSALNKLLITHASSIAGHLSVYGVMQANKVFEQLCVDQGEAVQAGGDPYRLPLAWMALAETVGLVVDPQTGQIIDGPHAPMPPTAQMGGTACWPTRASIAE